MKSLRLAWGTAALLGLAASLLAFVAVRQGLDLVRLRRPQLNPPLVSLQSVDVTRRASAAAELRFPAGAERAWVVLVPGPETRLDDSIYDIHLVASDGYVVHRFEGIPKSEKSDFRLEIPRRLLHDGIYRFMLVTTLRIRLIDQFDLNVNLLPETRAR